MSKKLLPRFLLRDFQQYVMQQFLLPEARIALTAARGAGKDFTGVMCANTLAVCKPGSNIVYLGVSLKAVKKILTANDDKTGKPMFMGIIDTDLLKPTLAGDYFHREMSCFKYKNGSILYIAGSDQNSELGTSVDALIITESSRIPRESWKYIKGNVNRANGRILEISTPFYSSDFNELIDGNLPESQRYIKVRVPANILHNADGSRVYPDDKLTMLRAEFDSSSFEQEYMCSTAVMNSFSVLGESLLKARRVPVSDFTLGQYRELYFSFDLGQSDYTVMYTCYKDEKMDFPVIVNRMIKNQTNLEEFIEEIHNQVNKYSVNKVNIILPFDAAHDIQGYSGKLNRKKEIEKHVPYNWRVNIIQRTDNIRLLQITRRVLETNRLGIIAGELGDAIIKELASVNYKENKITGKPTMEVDKRSGIYEDHVIDSLKYLVAYIFGEMFEEGYDKNVRDKIMKSDVARITNVNIPGFRGRAVDNLISEMMTSKLKGNSFSNFRGNF